MPMGGWIHPGGALREPVHLGLLFVKEEMDTQYQMPVPQAMPQASERTRQD